YTRCLLVRRGLLRQLALDLQRALAKHLERAPAGAVARDRVGGQPLAVDVAGEVGTGVLRIVDLVERQPVDRRQLALVDGQRGRGGTSIGGAFGRRGATVA